MTRRALPLAAAAAVLASAAVPATAPAATKIKVSVGLGDQNASTFSQPAFRALKIRKVRYFIPWNAARSSTELAKADAFVAAARSARARVFLHIHTDDIRVKKGKLPSVKQYRREVSKLVRRYKPKGVKEWGAWNEVNHKTQPTYTKTGMKRAAQYFLEMRKFCKKCTIVGLDVLDQRGVERYMAGFYKALGSKRRLVSIVGIHNYSDTNRFRSRGTASIIKTARKYNSRSKFWLTETGGVAAFGTSFPFDLARQARAIDYMFKLTKQFRKRGVQRLYSYNYWGAPLGFRFDAGLVNDDGSPRPAYQRFAVNARRFVR